MNLYDVVGYVINDGYYCYDCCSDGSSVDGDEVLLCDIDETVTCGECGERLDGGEVEEDEPVEMGIDDDYTEMNYTE